MFEQTFKNIDDILHKDAGCTSELDYTEQSSWLLFLKYLDALERDKAAEAELVGKRHDNIIDPDYRWEAWAAPKTPDGKFDHNAAMTGDDLREFVNAKLFPYLAGFKQRASGPNTIEYKMGEVFGEVTNKIQGCDELLKNLRMNCIPEAMVDGEIKPYDAFLEERRKLMAMKIKQWLEVL